MTTKKSKPKPVPKHSSKAKPGKPRNRKTFKKTVDLTGSALIIANEHGINPVELTKREESEILNMLRKMRSGHQENAEKVTPGGEKSMILPAQPGAQNDRRLPRTAQLLRDNASKLDTLRLHAVSLTAAVCRTIGEENKYTPADVPVIKPENIVGSLIEQLEYFEYISSQIGTQLEILNEAV